MNSHKFALYIHQLPSLNKGHEFSITDTDVVHRIQRILRLQIADELILFDKLRHLTVRIAACGKKDIVVQVLESHVNQLLKPTVSFLLPILKKEAFESAVYFLVEAGINDIYPVVTAKAHRSWGGDKEKSRLDRIMIAAAEQSKHFALTTLHDPITLPDAEQFISSFNIFFDSNGKPFRQILDHINRSESLTLLIGPEGDLTSDEKSFIDKVGFVRSRLTPTILRAEDAAGVAACLIRSL